MKMAKFAMLLVIISSAGLAWGANTYVTANVERILVTGDNQYGGCMVLLDKSLSSEGLDCPGAWITLSCSGELATRQEGQRVFDAALLGYALNRQIRAHVYDNRKHNGWCWARRVEVLSE